MRGPFPAVACEVREPIRAKERAVIRALDLRGAVAVNVITMIGAGPLITIPLVVTALHGSISL